tara:strand:- start:469 stop:1044 length:576 start_codon:yes stop_codon:yes gene_type:complete
MSNLKNLLSILILLMFTQSYGFSKEFIGVISAGIGDITNQNDEKLSTGSKIFDGDTIFVKEKSNAQILLLDETALTIGEKSELTIDDFVYDPKTKVGKIVSNIKLGTVRIITGEISKQNPDNLNIKVPTGSIGARGTEFAVLTESNNKSTIVLLGPGKNNTLGMIPGVLKVSDGFNSVDLTQPGFQSVVFE